MAEIQLGVIDVGQDLFTIHTFFLLNRSCFENSFLVLGGTVYLRHADSAQGNGRCRHRCADDAQHQTGDQKCKTFQTTFHNTVPPEIISDIFLPLAEKYLTYA